MCQSEPSTPDRHWMTHVSSDTVARSRRKPASRSTVAGPDTVTSGFCTPEYEAAVAARGAGPREAGQAPPAGINSVIKTEIHPPRTGLRLDARASSLVRGCADEATRT